MDDGMKLSVIFPVLNSHEIVRRQLIHFNKMGLSNDVEIILVDDGSDPPLMSDPFIYGESVDLPNFQCFCTFDERPWTWALARNHGARIARGKNLLLSDLDYIIPKEVIELGINFDGDYVAFKREFGVLDEDGNFKQDIETLVEWGWDIRRYEERGFQLPPHPNEFIIRRDLFFDMGMYREDLVEKEYPQGEDRDWKRKRMKWENDGKLKIDWHNRPTIYMFPNGQWCVGKDVDTNPFGMFHDLTRKTKANPWYK